jgi:glutathione S-transferase
MPRHLQLISFELCPYVERSRIVLLEKGVPHEVTFIDLAAKPAWFLALSPMGKVPVLVVDGRPIFESAVINELIEELYPAPPLLPADPLDRAEARAWVVFANDALMPASLPAMLALAGGRTGEPLEGPLGQLRTAVARLEARLAGRPGPYFLGPAFSLVDAAFAPFFRRWAVMEARGGPAARLLDAAPAVAAWAGALRARPAVVAAEPADFAARQWALLESRAAKLPPR